LSEKDLEQELRGKTLQVYWYILRTKKPVTAREVQRHLHLSSPSVAIHHLEKLARLGLLSKDSMGQYNLVEEVKAGLLRFFIRTGGYVIPRYFLYLAYFTGLLIFYILAFNPTLNIKDIYIMLLGLSSITISIYELAQIRQIRQRI
jgi:hypothetical protein